jgi:selenide, water dikinase
VHASAVRLLPGVTGFIAAGVVPGGTLNNLSHCQPWITWDDDVADVLRTALADAQTSGGLLIALDSGQAPALLDDLRQAGMSDSAIIGEILDTGPGSVHIGL